MRDFLLFRFLEIFKKTVQLIKLKKIKIKIIKKTELIEKIKKTD